LSEKSGPNPEAKVYAGVKWGLQNPSVILVGEYLPPPMDELTLVHEFYRPGVLLPEMVRAAKDLAEKFAIRKFFCDPTEPRFIERLKKERLWAVAVKDEELAGINLISERLQKTREAKPGRLVLSRECKNLIFEFQRFHAPERDPNKPYRDKPVQVHNYALDALRFMVLGLSYEATPKVRWL
jgi:hypothetical protein